VDEILRGDPFARLLWRSRVSPAIFGLLVLVYGLVRTLLLPAVFGHLRTVQIGGKTILGVLDDWPLLVVELVMVPLIAGYYLWQPSTMQAVYDGIAERLGRNPAAVARTRELAKPIGWAGWTAVALVIGLFEAAYVLYIFHGYTILTWETVNTVNEVSGQLIRFATFYMLVFIVVRQAFMIVGLNRFFSEFHVEIAPLHPDKAGGLRILGDYVLTTGFIFGAVGLNFGMGLLRLRLNPGVLTAEFYVSMVVYFILAPLLFLLPLVQVHQQMRNAKKKLLAEVAEQFDLEYRKLLDGLRRNELEPKGISHVEAIQKIYQITESAPVWPFDIEIMSKFAAAAMLPILVPLGLEVLNRLFFR
jgi:hypothetical protein